MLAYLLCPASWVVEVGDVVDVDVPNVEVVVVPVEKAVRSLSVLVVVSMSVCLLRGNGTYEDWWGNGEEGEEELVMLVDVEVVGLVALVVVEVVVDVGSTSALDLFELTSDV